MAKLYYFDGRGLGEIVRLCLAAAGIEFTEEFLTTRERFMELINDKIMCWYNAKKQRTAWEIHSNGQTEQFATVICAEYPQDVVYIFFSILEGKLMFNQIPLLEIDGKNLVETKSIARYLGRKAGLAGKNEDEAVLIDMYFEGGRDFLHTGFQVLFMPEKELLAKMKEAIAKSFPIIEKILASNGTGFFVGNSLTLADISWIEPLLMYEEYLGTEIFINYPAVKKFNDNVTSQPQIAAFLKGPQRKRKLDARTVEDINRVLCIELKLQA